MHGVFVVIALVNDGVVRARGEGLALGVSEVLHVLDVRTPLGVEGDIKIGFTWVGGCSIGSLVIVGSAPSVSLCVPASKDFISLGVGVSGKFDLSSYGNLDEGHRTRSSTITIEVNGDKDWFSDGRDDYFTGIGTRSNVSIYLGSEG